MGPMGVYQIFSTASEPMSGDMMTKPDAVPAPFWLYYFNVAGIDSAAERVKAGGGEISNDPHQVPGGSWIVHCRDRKAACSLLLGHASKLACDLLSVCHFHESAGVAPRFRSRRSAGTRHQH